MLISFYFNRILKVLIFTLFSLCAFRSIAQEEVETIVLKKNSDVIYQGISQETRDWYICIDKNGIWYMASILGADISIEFWFSQRKDSQNILKGEVSGALDYSTVSLYRENDLESNLVFYINQKTKQELNLTLIETGEIFIFKKLDPQ
jgi:hypothetical protein